MQSAQTSATLHSLGARAFIAAHVLPSWAPPGRRAFRFHASAARGALFCPPTVARAIVAAVMNASLELPTMRERWLDSRWACAGPSPPGARDGRCSARHDRHAADLPLDRRGQLHLPDDHPVLARPAISEPPPLRSRSDAALPVARGVRREADRLRALAPGLVEVAISYVLALVVYYLLRRRLELERLAALSLALLFLLSPYVFGTSFRVITDNLATLFIVVAVERFERSRQTRSVVAFLVGCVALAAAMLTRQSTAFMLAVGGLYALRAGSTLLRRAELAGAVALTVIPVGLLFLSWHGIRAARRRPELVCAVRRRPRRRRTRGGARRPDTRADAGDVRPLLRGAVRAGTDRRGARRQRLAACAAHTRAGPAGGRGAGRRGSPTRLPRRARTHTAGLLWNAAARLPNIAGSSLLFWGLVPAACALLGWRALVAPHRWLLFAFFASFLLGALAIRYPWQKYVDPFALLAIFFTVRREDFTTARSLAGAGVLAMAFIAYAPASLSDREGANSTRTGRRSNAPPQATRSLGLRGSAPVDALPHRLRFAMTRLAQEHQREQERRDGARARDDECILVAACQCARQRMAKARECVGPVRGDRPEHSDAERATDLHRDVDHPGRAPRPPVERWPSRASATAPRPCPCRGRAGRKRRTSAGSSRRAR